MKSSKRINTLFIAFLGIGLLAASCKREGCTDPIATNYDKKANHDDGTCIYGPGDGGPGGTMDITEDVTTATTWSAGTINVCGDIDVEAALTISPGVTLIMCAGASITVSATGSITAIGDASNIIRFKGEVASAGYWEGISIKSNNPNNQFDYVQVSDAGSYWAWQYSNVFLGSLAKLSIKNSTFSNSEKYGLFAEDNASFPAFVNNTFSSNTLAGLNIGVYQVGSLDAASNYNVSNGEAFINVRAGALSTTATWVATTTPYLLVGDMAVSSALTLNPGVHIMVESGGEIDIDAAGSFTAIGSAALPIIIEGRFSSPGYWTGVNVGSNNPNNKFNYVTIADGGSYWAYQYAGIHVDGRLDLDNSTVTNSNSYGVFVKPSSVLYCSGAVQTDVPGVTAVNTLTGNGVGPDADCVDGCMVFFD